MSLRRDKPDAPAMTRSAGSSTSPLTIHANLWIEREATVVLSRWRVQLLDAIEATGSIRAAAAQMKVTYHLAWHRLDEMETALGLRLVERRRGGLKGGHAQLTAAGHDYVERFKRLATEVDAMVATVFERTFGEG
jgi:molybdate transport system regulatory protein